MPAPSGAKKRGIYRPTPQGAAPSDDEQRVAEFSYQNDALADLIVDAWSEPRFLRDLTDKASTQTARSKVAQDALDDRGIHMSRPIVITEDEYYAGFTMEDPNGVVFVLPNGGRANPAQDHSLLEVAKLLMACTPNGI
jgi:hypothetical protein